MNTITTKLMDNKKIITLIFYLNVADFRGFAAN